MWQTSPDPPARFWFICQSCLQPFPVYLLTWRTEGWALTLAGPAARHRPCAPPSPHARRPRRGRAGCLHDQRCARKQTPFLAQLQSPAKLTSNGKNANPTRRCHENGASSASSDAEGLGGSRSAGGGHADAPPSKTASAEARRNQATHTRSDLPRPSHTPRGNLRTGVKGVCKNVRCGSNSKNLETVAHPTTRNG